MKEKKLLLPVIIISVALVAMIASAIITGIAKKPVITEAEFPFTITYELDGKTETIEDVYTCEYTGNGGYVNTMERLYEGRIEGCNDEISIMLKEFGDDTSRCLMIHTNFYPGFMMGDDDEVFDRVGEEYKPVLLYYDEYGCEHSDAATLDKYGAKLISWDYPDPIVNEFEFSHISRMCGGTALPMCIIGLLALILCIIFVKRDKSLVVYTSRDKVSRVLNFIIAIVVLPFMSLLVFLSDIAGVTEGLINQIFYCTPGLTFLGLCASLSLRRRGYSKASLIVQLVPVAIFAVTSIFAC